MSTGSERRVARRAAWSVADQAASSLTNFTLSFLVLREIGIDDFGSFTIAFVTYLLAVNVGRALVGEPLVIRYSAQGVDEQRTGTRAAVGFSLGVGALAALVVVIAGLLAGGALADGLVPLAAVLPGLLLQDTVRFSFIASGRPDRAFFNDALWGVSQLAAVVILISSGRATVGAMLLAWGITGNIAAVVGLVQARVLPVLRLVRSWWPDHSDLGRRLVVETLIGRGVNQVLFYAIGAIAGLAALGSLNGARVLLGPVNVLYLGIPPFVIAETAIIRAEDPERLKGIVRWLAAGLAAVAATIGAVLFLIPSSVGLRLTASWPEVEPFIIPVSVWVASRGAIQAWRLGLRTLEAADVSLRTQMRASTLAAVGGVSGTVLAGGEGAAFGLMAAGLIAAVLWHRSFSRALVADFNDRGDLGMLTGEIELEG